MEFILSSHTTKPDLNMAELRIPANKQLATALLYLEDEIPKMYKDFPKMEISISAKMAKALTEAQEKIPKVDLKGLELRDLLKFEKGYKFYVPIYSSSGFLQALDAIKSNEDLLASVKNGKEIFDFVSKTLPTFDRVSSAIADQAKLLNTLKKSIPFEDIQGFKKATQSIQSSLNLVTKDIATIGYKKTENAEMQKVQEVASKSVNILAKQPTDSASLSELKEYLVKSFAELQASNNGSKFINQMGILIGIISILVTMFSIIQTYMVSEQETAPVIIRQDIKEEIIEGVKKIIEKIVPGVFVRRECGLRSKATKKKSFICAVKKGENATIVGVSHKYANILIVSKQQQFPITGWILKKHLIKRNPLKIV